MSVNTRPLISVIVPNYNHRQYLPARLASIMAQSYSNIEVILLDDASQDESQLYLSEFAKECSLVSEIVLNSVNSGRTIHQWACGAKLAKGQFTWIAESDDEALPAFLSTLVKLLNSNPSVGLAYCDSNVINAQGDSLGTYCYTSLLYEGNNPWQNNFLMRGKEFVGRFLAFRNVIPNVSAVLFKTHVLQAYLQDNPLKYCADWELYTRILKNYDIAYNNQPLNYFRKHVMTTRWHSRASYAAELKEKMSLVKGLKESMPVESPYQLNINKSLNHMFRHRHKHRRIAEVVKTLISLKLIGQTVILYGANDIAETIAFELNARQICFRLMDGYKAEQLTLFGRVYAPSTEVVSKANYIVLCSLNHQEDMLNTLQNFSFSATIVRL